MQTKRLEGNKRIKSNYADAPQTSWHLAERSGKGSALATKPVRLRLLLYDWIAEEMKDRRAQRFCCFLRKQKR